MDIELIIQPHERRQHQRRVLRGPSQIQFENQPFMKTRTMDVSISGLGIVAPVNPPGKTTCTIRFLVPVDTDRQVTVTTSAVVTHSVFSGAEDGFKVGLMFTGLSAETTAILQRYVKS
jgi:c-di-GMP-binding flagellar brake protein YcgR